MQPCSARIELLREAEVESWNAWRLSDLSMRPRLEGVELSNLRLRGVVLWRSRLKDCVLDGADLRGADMRECDLSSTSFVGADMTGAACWQSRFHACDLRRARVDLANFEECTFDDSAASEVLRATRPGQNWCVLPPWYSKERPQPADAPKGSLAIALLGDCTVYCGYLPPSERQCGVLARSFAEPGFEIPAFVYDLSDDGETVAGLLRRYERDLLSVPRIDVAFVRYGITDRKEYGAERFIELLGELCRRIDADFPEAEIVIETGMHVDYPVHYPFDRNAKLSPLYDMAERFAAERGYRVVDIYSELEERTIGGDWDWRIRGLGVGKPTSLHDASRDHLHEGDRDWFFNVHPNERCIRLIAEMERDVIEEIYKRSGS